MSRSGRLKHESSRFRLERGWSSDGTLCCQLDVGFHTDNALRGGGPLKVSEIVESRKVFP